MIQIIKSKTTKEQKLKVLLKVEKRFNGLAITVKAKDFNKFVSDFYTRYNKERNKSFDYLPNPHTIITSMNWDDNWNSNRLINGKYINITIFKKFVLNDIIEQIVLLNNVFTNDEIKAYIETFESMIIKMKQLMNEKPKRKRVVKTKDPLKTDQIMSESLRTILESQLQGSTSNSCGRAECELCNRQRNLIIEHRMRSNQ